MTRPVTVASSPSYSPEHGGLPPSVTLTNRCLALVPRLMEVANHLSNVDQDLVTEVEAKFDKLKPHQQRDASRNGMRSDNP